MINFTDAPLDTPPTRNPLFREGRSQWIHGQLRKIWIVSYATVGYQGGQMLLNKTAKDFGIGSISYGPEFLARSGFGRKNRTLLAHRKGAGFWAWKPFIISHALSKVPQQDVVVYVDADLSLVANPAPLAEECLDVGVGLYFLNQFIMRNWTKRDCFILMDCDTEEQYAAHKTQGGMNTWSKGCELSRTILRKWLHYAQDPRISTREPVSLLGPNLPEFKRHSTDQSILTCLAVKHGVKRFMPPHRAVTGPNTGIYRNQGVHRDHKILMFHGRMRMEVARKVLSMPHIWQRTGGWLYPKCEPPRTDVEYVENRLYEPTKERSA